MVSHVDPAKGLLGGLAALVGNGLCWAQSFEYGIVASAITSIGIAIAGAWIIIGQAKAKAYSMGEEAKAKAYSVAEEAKLKAEVEREKAMGPSITRQLQQMQKQMEGEARDRSEERARERQERAEMARRLEIAEEEKRRSDDEKHRLMLKLTESVDDVRLTVDRANETMASTTEKINKIARRVNEGPLVLIVEDDKDTSGQMIRLLKTQGYQVDFAGTVKEGISKLLNNPKFVILDVMLPDGSGFTVLSEVRNRTMDTKVIVCSALDHSDPTYSTLAAGTYPDFTTRKPVDVGILLDYLKDASAPRPHLRDIDAPRLSGDDIPTGLAKATDER